MNFQHLHPFDQVVAAVMLAGVLAGLFVGSYRFLWPGKFSFPGRVFGIMLISFSLTLLHDLFIKAGDCHQCPAFWGIPIYYTLAFGPLLFFPIKLRLYPGYRFKWTDVKHIVLPVGQIIFLVISAEFSRGLAHVERNFYSPFYGGFEEMLFLITTFLFMYFSHRYLRQKKREFASAPKSKEAIIVSQIRRMLRYTFIFFCFHATYVLTDFISYEFMNVNLNNTFSYAWLGELSFAGIALVLSYFGWKWWERV